MRVCFRRLHRDGSPYFGPLVEVSLESVEANASCIKSVSHRREKTKWNRRLRRLSNLVSFLYKNVKTTSY